MFDYCPKCKSKCIEFLEGKKWHCSACNFILYHNVAGAVAVIIKKDNNVLFTVRNQEPQKGKLDLPGGFIDPNESAEDCCVREIKEELFIKLPKDKLVYKTSLPNKYIYGNTLYNTIDLFYTIELDADITEIEHNEISEVVWVDLEKLVIDDLAFDSQKKLFKTPIFSTKVR